MILIFYRLSEFFKMNRGRTQNGVSDVVANMREHVLGFFNRKQQLVSSPADGMMLKLHYKQTFWLFATGFFMVYFNWFTGDVIRCVSHYNTEQQQRADYLNLCLSYPFIEVENERVTLLYYRWVHWVLLLCAFMFIVPYKLCKVPKNDKINRLVEFFSQSLPDYINRETQILNSVCNYFAIETNAMNGIFHRYIFANFLAFFSSFGAFSFLDLLFHGKFATLGIEAFPFTLNRDADNLSDPLTKAFPPFVDCEINDVMALTNKRVEKFGCHLLAQEYYEKLFLVIWYWLVFLMLAQACYLVFLICFCSRLFCEKLIRLLSSKKIDEDSLVRATKNFKAGDWFVLYKFRSCFLYDGLEKLIEKMADGVTMKKCIEHSKRQLPQIKNITKPAHRGILIE